MQPTDLVIAQKPLDKTPVIVNGPCQTAPKINLVVSNPVYIISLILMHERTSRHVDFSNVGRFANNIVYNCSQKLNIWRIS